MTKRATDIKDTDSTGSPRRETPSGATAQAGGAHPTPFAMRKRIGATVYEVEVHFSAEGGETMDDKILRMVRDSAVKSDMGGQK
ncbi:MAG: transposon-encoded TnpW family protein [Synergistaceae bacterium]|nr:transposon-encoded TnpW family protein [Synergistaceae bacterium]